jgi:hypothetical protein
MSGLTQIVSRVVGGRGTATGRRPTAGPRTTPGGAMGGGATSGRRTQDEAIGRGVRSLFRRFR